MGLYVDVRKHAIDSVAEAYWEAYFKEYGKQWVRKIPRRVAGAIAEHLNATARTAAEHRGEGSGGGAGAGGVSRARIVPFAWTRTATGGLEFEGLFRGTTLVSGAPVDVHHLFVASFGGDGSLLDLAVAA